MSVLQSLSMPAVVSGCVSSMSILVHMALVIFHVCVYPFISGFSGCCTISVAFPFWLSFSRTGACALSLSHSLSFSLALSLSLFLSLSTFLLDLSLHTGPFKIDPRGEAKTAGRQFNIYKNICVSKYIHAYL